MSCSRMSCVARLARLMVLVVIMPAVMMLMIMISAVQRAVVCGGVGGFPLRLAEFLERRCRSHMAFHLRPLQRPVCLPFLVLRPRTR